MNLILPENFRELLAAISFSFGVTFSLISLMKNKMVHSLRVSGMFLLLCLCLFANNGYSYFAAVFIIATAITQLEFLQNLAAIIRGSKEYFDYKRSFVPQTVVEENLKQELQELEESGKESTQQTEKENMPDSNENSNEDTKENQGLPSTNLSAMQFAVLVEEYVFRYLERKYSNPIQRHVSSGNYQTNGFDGLMKLEYKDVIFEIKISRSGIYPSTVLGRAVQSLLHKAQLYQKTQKRALEVRFIFVSNSSENRKKRIMNIFEQEHSKVSGLPIYCDFYSFEEIGVLHILKDYESKHNQ